MQALLCSSAVGIILVESGLVPRRDCQGSIVLVESGLVPRRDFQGSIVGNLELYVPENAEDNSVLLEVRADVQTFRDLHEELRLIVDPTADETWSSVLRSCRDAQAQEESEEETRSKAEAEAVEDPMEEEQQEQNCIDLLSSGEAGGKS
eukprot:s1985_g17.t1